MAIDTAAKRKSISSVVVTSPGVSPLASPDVAWRWSVGYTYYVEPAVGVPVDVVYGFLASDDVGFHILAVDVGRRAASYEGGRKVEG